MIDLIYCAGGNRRFAEIAIANGFLYGAQLPNTIYYPLHFADQDWKNPQRERYLQCLKQYHPQVATVLDWERMDQLPEVLGWAEDAAAYVEELIIVPKVMGGIPLIPQRIGGRPIRLGYSVPTKYGATELPVWEFANRRIHLLGGGPRRQMQAWRYLSPWADVVSADGNVAHQVAIKWAAFFLPEGTARHAKNRRWPHIQDVGMSVGHDAPYRAFELSCQNIRRAWRELLGEGDGNAH